MIAMIAVVSLTGVVSWMVANELIAVADNLPSYSENIHKAKSSVSRRPPQER